MLKLILLVVSVLVICGTVCFTANRVCNSLDAHMVDSTDKHIVLRREHETLMREHRELLRVGTETKRIASDTNRKITFLYNMVRNSNPDMWNSNNNTENDDN